MNALHKTFSERELRLRWREFSPKFSKKTASGIDKVTRDKFKKEIDNNIQEISTEVRKGKYKFSPLKPIAISKSDGGLRLINVPTIKDRFVQRVVLEFLKNQYGDKWKMPKSFSSLGKGDEGVHNTLKLIGETVDTSSHVIRADLSKFFDTIHRDEMKKIVRKKIRHSSFHSLIYKMIDSETAIRSLDDQIVLDKSGIKKGKGLRQGMPISPVLSYLYLMEVDMKFSNSMFRYVDDVLIFSPSKTEAKSKFNQFKKLVEKRGLRIHPLNAANEKTVYVRPNEKFEFLGVQINRTKQGTKFLIPSKSILKIENRIKEICICPSDKKKQKNWLFSVMGRPSGIIRDYQTAYGFCENWPSLETLLRAQQKSMCRKISKELHRLSKTPNSEDLMRVFGVID